MAVIFAAAADRPIGRRLGIERKEALRPADAAQRKPADGDEVALARHRKCRANG